MAIIATDDNQKNDHGKTLITYALSIYLYIYMYMQQEGTHHNSKKIHVLHQVIESVELHTEDAEGENGRQFIKKADFH